MRMSNCFTVLLRETGFAIFFLYLIEMWNKGRCNIVVLPQAINVLEGRTEYVMHFMQIIYVNLPFLLCIVLAFSRVVHFGTPGMECSIMFLIMRFAQVT